MKRSENLKKLIVCALMIAVASVLSFVKIDMPMGGGLTVCSMVPIVLAAYLYGPKWGLSCAFVYSVFQLLFGLDNVAYATNIGLALLIIFFDYIVAYTVIGLAGFFRSSAISVKRIVLASVTVLTLRFVCHFITGIFVWDALWPNEFGLSSAVYSLAYNGIYMLPEIITTSIACALLCSSRQITNLLVKELSGADSNEGAKDHLVLFWVGIAFIVIQIAAYVGLSLTGSMSFLFEASSAGAVLKASWELFSASLVGIIGIILTVCGALSIKKSKK
ncbi:MAG: energy-coupled thiamine transporter ThiT [Clostridia bacterium]|nr:energy-coupled thiamine transporter ThiT [Clostridia bacterium]